MWHDNCAGLVLSDTVCDTRHTIFNILLHLYICCRVQHTLSHCTFMW
jgi:hypothetical protein